MSDLLSKCGYARANMATIKRRIENKDDYDKAIKVGIKLLNTIESEIADLQADKRLSVCLEASDLDDIEINTLHQQLDEANRKVVALTNLKDLLIAQKEETTAERDRMREVIKDWDRYASSADAGERNLDLINFIKALKETNDDK